MSNSAPTLDQITKAALSVLEDYLPTPTPQLPAPSVVIARVSERSSGLGNRVGEDRRGALSAKALKSLRVEAVARFQLWAGAASAVEDEIQQLVAGLLADREKLRSVDSDGDGKNDLQILRLALKSIGASEPIPSDNAWRQSADFSLLAEFPYADSDEAQSLIAKIPIEINSAFGESTVVTDEMTRWDDESAPALIVRGRRSVSSLSALVFIPGTVPSGAVTLLRAFEGATAPPTDYPDLNSFLAAITDPSDPERNARVVLASVNDFLNVFSDAGDPALLGDWDENDVADSYQPKSLTIDPSLQLPGGDDRLEIAFQHEKFDQVAVVYLRAAHGLTS